MSRFRIRYDFDLDTQILETTIYQNNRRISTDTVLPPKSLKLIKLLRQMEKIVEEQHHG